MPGLREARRMLHIRNFDLQSPGRRPSPTCPGLFRQWEVLPRNGRHWAAFDYGARSWVQVSDVHDDLADLTAACFAMQGGITLREMIDAVIDDGLWPSLRRNRKMPGPEMSILAIFLQIDFDQESFVFIRLPPHAIEQMAAIERFVLDAAIAHVSVGTVAFAVNFRCSRHEAVELEALLTDGLVWRETIVAHP